MKEIIKLYYNKIRDSELYSRIVGNFTLSISGALFNMIIRLLNMSLLTKLLTVEGYGKVQIVLSLCNFLIFFLDIKMEVMIYKYLPKFRKEKKDKEILGLFWLSILYCLVLGLFVFSIVFWSSELIATTFYEDKHLSQIISMYSWSIIISTFTTVCSAILRLHNHFKFIVIPQSISALSTLLLIFTFYYLNDYINIKEVIIINLIGVIIAKLPALIKTSLIFKNEYKAKLSSIHLNIKSLHPYRKEISNLLFQTNLEGYLKLGAEKGGIFLLGIFSTPTQVAYFTIAKNLIVPLRTLRKNINTSLSPELYNLLAKDKYSQVNNTLRKLFIATISLSVVALFFAFLTAKPIFTFFTKSEYLNALPNFYIQLIVFSLSFFSIFLYSIYVTTNQLKRRNKLMTLQIMCIAISLVIGINAINLAIAQLVGNLIIIIFSDIYVYRKFINDYLKDKKHTSVTS